MARRRQPLSMKDFEGGFREGRINEMKKLFGKGILFVGIICLLCTAFVAFSMREPYRAVIAGWMDSEEFMDESEMLPYFEQAGMSDGTTQLVIGDSICRQMFAGLGEYNPQMSIQATNAALMITGQYLLAEEYLKAHPEATDVFLVMHPMALTRTFDTEWGYRYGVMTYVETDTIKYLDENTLNDMAEVYGRLFMRKEAVNVIENSPIMRKLYLSYININRNDYVQSSPFEIADQYVKNLHDLCTESGVTLHVYASPVSEAFRDQTEELEKAYGTTWMSSCYPDYFQNILYYPNEWSEDESHFSGEHAKRTALNDIIAAAYERTPLLDNLKINN